MYSISARVKLFSKINLPKYNLGLSLKVEVRRFKESRNGTTCCWWELLSNMQQLSLILISLFLCLLKMVIKSACIVTLPLGWHTRTSLFLKLANLNVLS